MRAIPQQAPDAFVEVGTGKVLRGLLAHDRSDRDRSASTIPNRSWRRSRARHRRTRGRRGRVVTRPRHTAVGSTRPISQARSRSSPAVPAASGSSVPRTLAARGATVAIFNRSVSSARKRVRALRDEARTVHAFRGDIASNGSGTRRFAKAIEQLGRVDVLVNKRASRATGS